MPLPFPAIEVYDHIPHFNILTEVREPTNNPVLEAWYAVRQEWITNGGRVTPELIELEGLASHATTD